MVTLYVQLTSQVAPDAARSKTYGILIYSATSIFELNTYNCYYDYGVANDATTLPYPTFTGDIAARVYYDSIACDSLVSTSNAYMTVSYFDAYEIEVVAAPVYASFQSLATVARTGNYTDLVGLPTIPAAQVNADWDASSGLSQVLNKPSLSAVATTGNYADLTGTPSLATVATTGSYTDLSSKPTIPAAQVNVDWSAASGISEILNKPDLATVATTGNYSDLSGQPSIPASQVNADWNSSSGISEVLNKPVLATVATSGSYVDLTHQPTIPAAQVAVDWSASSGITAILNKPTLSTVATTGAYSSLTGTPTIPAAQVAVDWNAVSGISEILNKPSLASVATTGSYSSLTGTPSLATVATTGAYSNLTGTPTLATVATSGSYTDLSNKPTIPAAQVNADWNATTGSAQILNKPTKLTAAYDGTTLRSNAFPVFLSGTVASGTITFNITVDSTSGGTAIFPTGPILNSLNFIVSNSTAIFPGSWAWSNSNKTVTLTLGQAAATGVISLLGLNLLSAPATAANGTAVLLSVWGY